MCYIHLEIIQCIRLLLTWYWKGENLNFKTSFFFNDTFLLFLFLSILLLYFWSRVTKWFRAARVMVQCSTIRSGLLGFSFGMSEERSKGSMFMTENRLCVICVRTHGCCFSVTCSLFFAPFRKSWDPVVNSEISVLIRLPSQCCCNSKVLSINYCALALGTFELANPIMLA